MRIVTNSEQVERYLKGHHEIFLVDNEEITSDWYDPDQFELVVVDIDATQGAYTPRAIRKQNSDISIIGVSEDLPFEGEWTEQRAIFIEQGGSYLLQAPINPREMMACIGALDKRLRRVFNHVRLCHGRFVINPEYMSVLFDDKIIGCTAYETRVLVELAKNYGRFVSRTDIGKIIYPIDYDERNSNTIEVFITRIRAKLNSLYPGLASCVKTVRGFGYQLVDISSD
jgi:DNA-binding response OmpR family regulator